MRLLILVFVINPLYSIPKRISAVCIVPVADLLSQKLSATGHHTVQEKYALIPLSEKEPLSLCCRTTQLLFNERVTVIDQQGEQSYIETPFWHLKNSFSAETSDRNNRFWILTKNLKFLEELTSEENATIPPIDTENLIGEVITLILPWYCQEASTTYSAGTQFVITQDNDNDYQIKLYNPKTSSLTESTVPKNISLLTKKRSEKEKRELFLKTVQRWVHEIPGSIPYVIGGASILKTLKDSSFYEKKMSNDKIKGTAFMRSECTTTPHTGVDCSGLIRLACKIAGIPMNATNSTSIAQSLFTVTEPSLLQDGDIIFWKGHIAILSDIKQGLLIEARGYDDGYGLLQEIPYFIELKGIDDTKELMDAYINKKSMPRLDKKGHFRKKITDLTILSLLPTKPNK